MGSNHQVGGSNPSRGTKTELKFEVRRESAVFSLTSPSASQMFLGHNSRVALATPFRVVDEVRCIPYYQAIIL